MNLTILYPADFFDLTKVDADYEYEYREAVKFPEFRVAFYNYDELTEGKPLRLYPPVPDRGRCIYRGWMLQPETYSALYQALQARGLTLINSPEEYEHSHEFPNSYPLLKAFTPKIRTFSKGEVIDWDKIKCEFSRFMMKDYVKSVKGSNFPVYFDGSYSNQDLDRRTEEFIRMRDKLFVKGIVIKEYVDLRKTDQVTNEYRAFYLNGSLLTLSKNSNQKSAAAVPDAFVQQIPRLNSNFYTVDFAELADGRWIVIETGDGQVSGLSPGQYVFKFYDELLNGLKSSGQEPAGG